MCNDPGATTPNCWTYISGSVILYKSQEHSRFITAPAICLAHVLEALSVSELYIQPHDLCLSYFYLGAKRNGVCSTFLCNILITSATYLPVAYYLKWEILLLWINSQDKASSCLSVFLSVCPLAWKNSAPNRRGLLKLDIRALKIRPHNRYFT